MFLCPIYRQALFISGHSLQVQCVKRCCLILTTHVAEGNFRLFIIIPKGAILISSLFSKLQHFEISASVEVVTS